MAVLIRDADLERDRQELITFLYDNLTRRSDDVRYRWLYLENPFGHARAWIAKEGSTGQTIGLAAAFPRMVWVDGQPMQAWTLGDLCVAPGSRSLGPALCLQRACLQSLANGRDLIWFDFPSQSMMAVYRRLGVTSYRNHVRYVKVLRIEKKIETYMPIAIARSIGRLGNCALRLRGMDCNPPAGVEISLHDGSFGEQFTTLDSETVVPKMIRGLRTSRYLNWRYVWNPFDRYRTVVAARGSRLIGYALVETNVPAWTVTDLHAVDEASTIPALLAYVEALGRSLDAESISIPVLEGAALVTHLRRAGFYRREALPVIATAGDSAELQNAAAWFLMHGDRES
jgi:hypothetical protein